MSVFSNNSYTSSQGANFCNIFQWATLPDGYYHTQYGYRGVSAALGSVLHYILMQYDTSQTGYCEFYGYQGSGTLSIPSSWVAIGQGIILSALALLFLKFGWLLISYYPDYIVDVATKPLNSFVRLAADMKRSIKPLFSKMVTEFDTLNEDIMKNSNSVMVRYGFNPNSLNYGNFTLQFGTVKKVLAIKKLLKRVQRDRKEAQEKKEFGLVSLSKKVESVDIKKSEEISEKDTSVHRVDDDDGESEESDIDHIFDKKSRASMSTKSSASSVSSMNVINFMKSTLKAIYSHEIAREIRQIMAGVKFQVIFWLTWMVISGGLVIYGTFVIPEEALADLQSFNG
jgi:hypothetical protein